MDVDPMIIIYTQIGVRWENGQVVDLLSISLETPSLWHSTDVLQVHLTPDVAHCVNLFMYHVNQNDSTLGKNIPLIFELPNSSCTINNTFRLPSYLL